MNRKKYGYLIIALLLVFSCCFSACNKETPDQIVAYQNNLMSEDGISSRRWTIYFEENHIVDMTMELNFDTQENAEKFYNMLPDDYRSNPERNLQVLDKQIVYNDFLSLDRAYYAYFTYKDMIKEIQEQGGWIIEGMEEE